MKIYQPDTEAELRAAIAQATPAIIDALFLAADRPKPIQLDQLSRSLCGLTRLVDNLSRQLKDKNP